MMTNRKRQISRYGIITVIAFCLASLISFVSLNRSIAYAGTEKEVLAEVETIYVGDIINAKDYEIQAGSETVPAEGMVVVYPSGGVYGGDSFEIYQAGNYQITYYAMVGGNRVENVQKYTAIRRPKDIMILEDGMTATIGDYYVESPYELTKGITGTIVNFKAGQSVTFTTRIKTAKLTKDYNIVEMIVMPSVFKETDFERLTVIITDANDPTNYVEVLIDSSNPVDGDGQVSYVRTAANGQQYGGYENSTYHTAYYGAQVEHSFRALGCLSSENRKKHTVSEQLVSVSLDHAQRQVFCGPASAKSEDKVFVNDLDDPAHFKSNPWNGFTSDEVIVKVVAGKFVKGEGKVVFTSFGDYDLRQDIKDDEIPEITLDYEFTGNTVVAEVGKEFPLFKYEAEDALDNVIKSNVWVYHQSEGGQWVTINHDGEKFFVKYEGTYKIDYKAYDNSGNVATTPVYVEAVNKAPSINFEIDEPLIEKEVYQEVIVPLASQVAVTGGSGHLMVKREIISPSGKVLDVEEKLLLTEIGEYQVVYTATDYLGNEETYPVIIKSLATAGPKFINEPSFEKILIKGFTYELPVVKVVESVEGEVLEIDCKVYVNDALIENSFVAEGEKVTIRYVAEGVSGTEIWEREIEVVDTQMGKYRSKYFYVEGGVQLVTEKNALKMAVESDGKAEFANDLPSGSFSTILLFDETYVNFGAMKFILRDAENPFLTVTLSFSYDATAKSWFMQLNNGDKVQFITSKDVFSFTYVSGKNRIIDAGGEEMATISVYDNGDVFNGFSKTIYFAIEFENVVGESYIRLSQICNQSMGYNKSSEEKATDEVKPIIELDEMFIVRQKIGSKAQIPTASAYDVLNQISEFTISIMGPNGQLLVNTSADQTVNLNLNDAGYYNINYTAIDTNGNKAVVPYVMVVNDETAPVLTVNNNLSKEYNVGSKIYLPTYSVTDNNGTYFVQVTLILPNNEMRLLEYNESGVVTSLLDINNAVYDKEFKTGDGGFIATEKGKYVLRIVAYDEYYNYVVTEIEFKVN